MAKWEKQRDAKTSVLASGGTLQLAIFHLTAAGGGAVKPNPYLTTHPKSFKTVKTVGTQRETSHVQVLS